MDALRQIPYLLSLRRAVFVAFAVAMCGGALLLERRIHSAMQSRPTGSIEGAAASSETLAGQAERNDVQAAREQRSDLAHDFGVVPPGSVVAWAYPIENTSNFAWTIDNVHVLCRCTVPGVSARVIAPGKRESVTLRLSCGDEPADIVKVGTVYFKEPGAAPAQLLIKASVRPPMTASGREISFGGMAPRETAERALTLANYSATDWHSITITGCPAWIEAEVLPRPAKGNSPSGESRTAPRQVWQAVVRFTGNGLSEGYHQAPIRFWADTGDECEIHVTARLEPPVRIIPGKLVFGPTKPGELCVRVARVILQKGARVSDIRPIVDTREITADIRQISDSVWELKTTLRVPADRRVPDGRIEMSFVGGVLADAALPYSIFDFADSH